ncbi:MAG: hypothetical protein QXJ27_01430 [Thermoplasmata archaeon]
MQLLKEYYEFFRDEMEYDEFVKMVSEKRKLYGNLYDDETIVFYFLAKKGLLEEVLQKKGL